MAGHAHQRGERALYYRRLHRQGENLKNGRKLFPSTLGNPLYHWTHLELQRYFNIHTRLSSQTAVTVFEKTAEMLQYQEYRPVSLLTRMQVQVVCTTDDPVDDLAHHQKIRCLGLPVKVVACLETGQGA